MSTYIMVSFIAGIIGVSCRALILCLAKYPRTSEVNLGTDCVSLIMSVAFSLWAGYLLFGGEA